MKNFLRMTMTAVLAVVCNVAMADEVTFTLNDAMPFKLSASHCQRLDKAQKLSLSPLEE